MEKNDTFKISKIINPIDSQTSSPTRNIKKNYRRSWKFIREEILKRQKNISECSKISSSFNF
jgi:hypothetical protein